MSRRLPLALLLLVASAAGCRSAAPAAAPSAQRPAAPASAAPATGKAPIPEAVRWMRRSAEHRALFLEIYAMATAHVEQEAAKRAPGTWAVILDADETVIDNSTYQLERAQLGKAFDDSSWHAWTLRREAVPLPGAAAFLRRVHDLGGRIAIVTNRASSECPDTEAVFHAQALVYDVMLCKPEGESSDKNPRFEAVARGTAALPPLDVVAWLGDNIQDFPGLTQAIRNQDDAAFAAFGRRYFVFPNPMYGSWQRN